MSESTQSEIKSPCIGVCVINNASGFCHGCYRTTEEIKAWWGMNQVTQKDLLSALKERQLQTESFGD